ncbi:MAG: DUF515 domain-containing protein [Methanobacteriaceae archaeon]|nr:DUF515 domain-containing protein [Methanobacteriaceae archaeon]
MKKNNLRKKKKTLLEKIKTQIEKNKIQPKELYKKINTNEENEKAAIGAIVILLILIIILSMGYYYAIYQPQQQELNNEKTQKHNQLNQIFKEELSNNPEKQALKVRIDSATTKEEIAQINLDELALPALREYQTTKIDQQKDKYNRVQIKLNDSEYIILSVTEAKKKINSSMTQQLSNMEIKQPETVIIPIKIDRTQAASGLINVGDVVDIYKTTTENTQETQIKSNNTTENTITEYTTVNTLTNQNKEGSKITGGSKVHSILRSKESGEIDANIEKTQEPKNDTNRTQTTTTDIEQLLMSKSAGIWDETQLNILLEDYGWQLSDYERIANIGDLDIEYLVMIEVPQESTEEILQNMENIVLTIPSNNAPIWMYEELNRI